MALGDCSLLDRKTFCHEALISKTLPKADFFAGARGNLDKSLRIRTLMPPRYFESRLL